MDTTAPETAETNNDILGDGNGVPIAAFRLIARKIFGKTIGKIIELTDDVDPANSSIKLAVLYELLVTHMAMVEEILVEKGYAEANISKGGTRKLLRDIRKKAEVNGKALVQHHSELEDEIVDADGEPVDKESNIIIP